MSEVFLKPFVVSAKKIPTKDWASFLSSVKNYSEIYFVQAGEIPLHRHPDFLQEFLENRAYGSPVFSSRNHSFELVVPNLSSKNEKLDLATALLKRVSQFENKCDHIIAVMEEIILNALVSAPAVAQALGVSGGLGKTNFIMEWNSDEIWLHGQDPYGVFMRKNFQRSFGGGMNPKNETHGHSGRGLELILDSCTDLYIKSAQGWGTWVTARIDLRLSNKDSGKTPKRLLLEFE